MDIFQNNWRLNILKTRIHKSFISNPIRLRRENTLLYDFNTFALLYTVWLLNYYFLMKSKIHNNEDVESRPMTAWFQQHIHILYVDWIYHKAPCWSFHAMTMPDFKLHLVVQSFYFQQYTWHCFMSCCESWVVLCSV